MSERWKHDANCNVPAPEGRMSQDSTCTRSLGYEIIETGDGVVVARSCGEGAGLLSDRCSVGRGRGKVLRRGGRRLQDEETGPAATAAHSMLGDGENGKFHVLSILPQ